MTGILYALSTAVTPGEQYCYRWGRILFTGVTALRWDDQGGPTAVDASGELDYGSVDTFDHDGKLHALTGDFGRVAVAAHELPKVVLR